jgi:outer membrane receptor protein involved in Fe transport
VTKKHNLRSGLELLAQHDDVFFSLRPGGSGDPAIGQSDSLWGSHEAFYVEEQYKVASPLTLNGGMRLTHFAGGVREDAVSPRVGAAVRLPGLNWVLRGFYGRYYQAPPLASVSGSLLESALREGFSFLPLHGERDEQREFGLAIPIGCWAIDLAYYRTKAVNFFDHAPLGNSNLFIPLTVGSARLRGWETSLRSPRLLRRISVHADYSRQYDQGRGGVTGGLTEFDSGTAGWFYLDHDQRDTFAGGFDADLPWKAWITGDFSWGSGFLDGDGPGHLPHHATFDLALGKSIGERVSLRLTALNVADRRYLLDNSNTFGGTHFNYPRQLSLTLRYRFHY